MLVGPRQVVDAQLAGQAGKPVAVELVGQQLHHGGVGREEGEVVKRSPVGSYEEGGLLQRGGRGRGGEAKGCEQWGAKGVLRHSLLHPHLLAVPLQT